MSRKFTLAEKLALIYTSAGSQRNIAALTGLSHQKVGRILKGGYAPDSRALQDPGTVDAINGAFAIHTQIAKEQARADGLPYSADIPVFYASIQRKDGTKSDRAAAPHTHWLTNDLRESWVKSLYKSRKFIAATVRSTVDLHVYNKGAEKRAKQSGERTTPTQALYKEELKIREKLGEKKVGIYTPKTIFSPEFPISSVLADMSEKLTRKHEPATGLPGTRFADQIIVQRDTRKVKNEGATPARKTTPAKPGSPRKVKRRAKRRS